MTAKPMRPSRFRLPQQCSEDRRRTRATTLAWEQRRFELVEDSGPLEHEGQRFALPPHLSELPKELEFSTRKKVRLGLKKGRVTLNSKAVPLLTPTLKLESYQAYASLFRLLSPPPYASENWRSDLDFAAQRLNGCNPMQLHRCDDAPAEALWEGAQLALSQLDGGVNGPSALDQGRVFRVDYSIIAHPKIQATVPDGRSATAPTGLFYAHPDGDLRPLAIQLWPSDSPRPNHVITPQSDPAAWLLAKAHVQAADGPLHEGVSHLLYTHLTVEVVAVCTHRQLHPDHPISQLLMPHFFDNLAIDDQARSNLLAPGGPIDVAVGPGVNGILDICRMVWADWDFFASSPLNDLDDRGLTDPNILPRFFYRDDAVHIWDALHRYTMGILSCWYRGDADVVGDYEVQAWAAEIGGHLKGFPTHIHSLKLLGRVLTEVVFKASAQHAAVNNGQMDRYGWPPYSPGTLNAVDANERLAAGEPITEVDFWQALPPSQQSLGQVGMADVLSAPTFTSLVRTGDAEAFDTELSGDASREVGILRQRLRQISKGIRSRNAELKADGRTPYTYLDPYNISRSIEI